MSSVSIRRERGYLDTGRLARTPAAARPNPVASFLSEAGEMLRGAIEAPLRLAEYRAMSRDLDGLQDDLRKDIGLAN